MTDRYLGDGHSFAKIGAPHRYRIGDRVFFSAGNHTVAGEGRFLGRLKDAPDVLVLQIGRAAVETDAELCAPAGGNRAAEGASWRRAYLKDHPGAPV